MTSPRRVALEPGNADVRYAQALVHTRAGRRDGRLCRAGEAFRNGYSRVRAGKDPDLAPLRKHARYQDLMRVVPTGGANMILVPTLMLVGGLVAPAVLVGGPGVEVIEISFDKDCKHDVDNAETAKAKKQDRDVVVWSIVSECRDAREVTIRPKTHQSFRRLRWRSEDLQDRLEVPRRRSGRGQGQGLCDLHRGLVEGGSAQVQDRHPTPGARLRRTEGSRTGPEVVP